MHMPSTSKKAGIADFGQYPDPKGTINKKVLFLEKLQRMKSIIKLAVILFAMVPAVAFAQEKKPVWAELKNFHSFMSSTFHPAEENNLQPLKEKAVDMLAAAKQWQASEIPSSFKPKETKIQLEKLVKYCTGIVESVSAGANDATLKTMITEAHDVFHTIVGECRNVEEKH